MEDSTHIDSTKIGLYIQQLEFAVSNLEATVTRMKKECFDPKNSMEPQSPLTPAPECTAYAP